MSGYTGDHFELG